MRRAVVEVFPSIRSILILRKSAIIIADFFLEIFARKMQKEEVTNANDVIINSNFK